MSDPVTKTLAPGTLTPGIENYRSAQITYDFTSGVYSAEEVHEDLIGILSSSVAAGQITNDMLDGRTRFSPTNSIVVVDDPSKLGQYSLGIKHDDTEATVKPKGDTVVYVYLNPSYKAVTNDGQEITTAQQMIHAFSHHTNESQDAFGKTNENGQEIDELIAIKYENAVFTSVGYPAMSYAGSDPIPRNPGELPAYFKDTPHWNVGPGKSPDIGAAIDINTTLENPGIS